MTYSIIIPHKNSAELLHRLMKSIPKREDLEIIVVDDFSQENEKEKLQHLQKFYNFKLHLNSIGKGAGASRNTGLEMASGTYVLFADSDDYFTPALAHELDRIPAYDKDLICYKVNSVDSQSYQTSHRHHFFNELITNFQQRGKMDVRYKYSVPWGKVYRRRFIEQHRIRFAEVIAGNDMWFSCLCGILCSSFTVKEEILYTVTVREGSIVNTVNPAYFKSRFDETIRVNDLLRSYHLSRYQYSVLYFVSNAHKFGLKAYVAKQLLAHRSNILIGLEKIFKYKQVLVDRENRRVK